MNRLLKLLLAVGTLSTVTTGITLKAETTAPIVEVETVEAPVVETVETPVVEAVETVETPIVEAVETVETPVVEAVETVETPVVEAVEAVETPVVEAVETPVVEAVETPVVETVVETPTLPSPTSEYPSPENFSKYGAVQTSYVDELGGQVAESNLIFWLVGTPYTTEEKLIQGYELIETPANASGDKIQPAVRDFVYVTYVYRKTTVNTEAVIKTSHVDVKTNREITSPTYQMMKIGSEYTTEPVIIEGFTLIETPADATGIVEHDKTVTYKYSVDQKIILAYEGVSYDLNAAVTEEEFIKDLGLGKYITGWDIVTNFNELKMTEKGVTTIYIRFVKKSNVQTFQTFLVTEEPTEFLVKVYVGVTPPKDENILDRTTTTPKPTPKPTPEVTILPTPIKSIEEPVEKVVVEETKIEKLPNTGEKNYIVLGSLITLLGTILFIKSRK